MQRFPQSQRSGRAKFRMNEHSSFVCGTFPWLEKVSSVTGSVSRSERGGRRKRDSRPETRSVRAEQKGSAWLS